MGEQEKIRFWIPLGWLIRRIWKRLTLYVVAIALLSGCSAVKPGSWTSGEKRLAAAALTCLAGDLITTEIGLSSGEFREGNPMVRDKAVLIGSHILIPIAAYLWSENYGGYYGRTGIWAAIATPMCAVTGWNAYQLTR